MFAHNLFLVRLRRTAGGRAALGLGALALALLLQVLRHHLGVLGAHDALLLGSLLLERHDLSLALQTLWRDETLDLGRLELRLGLALLELERLAHHVLAHVVVLAQVEQLADVVGTLGAAHAWHDAVGEAVDLLLALLDDDKRQHAQVAVNDAALDGLAATLAAAALTIAGHALGHEQAHAVVCKDTLLHWEALFVVTAADADNVALPFIS